MNRSNQRFFSPRLMSLAVLVLFLGFVLYLDLWSEPVAETRTSFGVVEASTGSRAPASIGSDKTAKSTLVEPDGIADIEWDCGGIPSSHNLKNITQVRLTGSCLKEVSGVTNKNNGYTANIFHRDDEFTTDYVTLEPGTNKLEVKLADGAIGNFANQIEIVVEKQ